MSLPTPSQPNATDSDCVKELMAARDEAMAKLSSMVGIRQVKGQVTSQCETAIQNQRRRDMGISSSPMNNHMLFLGPPGTGKSSVAKIVAELQHKIGAAASDKLTVFESARTALVAGVVGATAAKTKAVLQTAMCTGLQWENVGSTPPTNEPTDELKSQQLSRALRAHNSSEPIIQITQDEWKACNINLRSDHYIKVNSAFYQPVKVGGVLMLDEAYSLIPMQGGADYSMEAINELVSFAFDNRDKLIIILAGYWQADNGQDIEHLFRTNGGFDSRFPRRIPFSAYEPDELLEIAKRMAKSKNFRLDDGAVTELRASKLAHSLPGNARDVLNILEGAIEKLNVRMGEIPSPSRDDLTTLMAEDFA